MSDEARARFRDFALLKMEAYKILPEDDERDLIGSGITSFELDGEQARGVVAMVAGQCDQILESDVSRHMMNVLHAIGGKRHSIGKKQFDQAVAILKGLVKGQITDPQARAWVKRLVEESDLKVRGRGIFRRKRWFRKIKAVR